MDHFFARDYLPQTGRFNGSDPVMEYSNPYSYVSNRPLNFVDPLGMQRNNGRRDDSAGPVRFGFLASGGYFSTAYYVDGVEVTGDFFYDAAGVENSSELAYKSISQKRKVLKWDSYESWESPLWSEDDEISKETYIFEYYENLRWEWVETSGESQDWLDGFLYGTGDVEQDIVNFTLGVTGAAVVVGTAAAIAPVAATLVPPAVAAVQSISASVSSGMLLASQTTHATVNAYSAYLGNIASNIIAGYQTFYLMNKPVIDKIGTSFLGAAPGIPGSAYKNTDIAWNYIFTGAWGFYKP